MPAKQKYLSSTGQRILKISAGILGGYMLSTAFHLFLAHVPAIGFDLLVSGTFSGFVLWVILMVFAFLARNGWVVWGIYLVLTLLFGLLAYLGGTIV